MIEFFINRNSVNPVLRMELILDGRYDYKKSLINNAIQDSHVMFSMKDHETGVYKIINAPAKIRLMEDGGCEEKYILEYSWTERDTRYSGVYDGVFEIKFNGNIKEEGVDYPTGNLIVPIQEELRIYIK
jgi:hypothetical protein